MKAWLGMHAGGGRHVLPAAAVGGDGAAASLAGASREHRLSDCTCPPAALPHGVSGGSAGHEHAGARAAGCLEGGIRLAAAAASACAAAGARARVTARVLHAHPRAPPLPGNAGAGPGAPLHHARRRAVQPPLPPGLLRGRAAGRALCGRRPQRAHRRPGVAAGAQRAAGIHLCCPWCRRLVLLHSFAVPIVDPEALQVGGGAPCRA